MLHKTLLRMSNIHVLSPGVTSYMYNMSQHTSHVVGNFEKLFISPSFVFSRQTSTSWLKSFEVWTKAFSESLKTPKPGIGLTNQMENSPYPQEKLYNEFPTPRGSPKW